MRYRFGMRLFAATLLSLFAVAASAQTPQVQTYGTSGFPSEALVIPAALAEPGGVSTAAGAFVLVTVSGNGSPGVDVFREDGTAGKLKRVAHQPLPPGNNAQGIVLLPHSRTLAVGFSNAGVVFLPLDDTLAGKAHGQVLPQGEDSGTGYLAATPDGRFLFAANEYGDHGNVSVIALHPGGTAALTPRTIAHISTPNATPGISISPDGTRVYTVGELIRPEIADRLAGHGVAELQHANCTQAPADRPMPSGVLYVIDVAKAEALTAAATPGEAHRAVIAAANAGCSPVRQASTADGKTLYVTARGDNRVLVFDTHALETGGGHAFLRAIPSGGEAPVGLALFAGDARLLVANSNRFAGGPGSLALFDVTDPAKPTLLQTIATGEFPRNVAVAPDGRTVYVCVYKAGQLLVLREATP